jgi:hypothetical protein
MFLKVLMHNEDELVRETDSPDDARREWSLLCADVLAVCDIDELQAFWERKWIQKWAWTADVMGVVWKYFVQRWLVGGGNWEGAVALLAVPFA